MMMPRPFPLLFVIGLFLSGCGAANSLAWPLPDAGSRPTPLHFGLYVTPDPDENPIDPPERFTGYHAATDFEVYRGEAKKDVPVYAICGGKIIFSGHSEGYGGLITQHCSIKGEPVTVIYGHLTVDSLVDADTLAGTGQTIGILGTGRSSETDGNRKHLHLGIVKGHGGGVAGYVQNESELDGYIDPMSVLR